MLHLHGKLFLLIKNMNIHELFRAFYYDRLQQEGYGSWDLLIAHLKRFSMGNSVYESTEEEFNKLLNLCREITKQNPKALILDQCISYHDSLDKKIGTHGFGYEGFMLNEQQIEEFVAKYYPAAG
jgi:hypothetical protein